MAGSGRRSQKGGVEKEKIKEKDKKEAGPILFNSESDEEFFWRHTASAPITAGTHTGGVQ